MRSPGTLSDESSPVDCSDLLLWSLIDLLRLLVAGFAKHLADYHHGLSRDYTELHSHRIWLNGAGMAFPCSYIIAFLLYFGVYNV